MADEEVTDLTEEEESPEDDPKKKKKRRGFGRKKKDSDESDEAGESEDSGSSEEEEDGKKKKRGRRGRKGKKGKDEDEDGEEAGDEAETDSDSESEGDDKDTPGSKPLKAKRGGGDGSAGTLIVMFLVAAVLIGTFIIALIFNVFGARAVVADLIRDPLVNFMIWLDPEFNMIDTELRTIAQARENRLNRREDIIASLEESLMQQKIALETFETQLNRRAAELDDLDEELQKVLERTIPLYRRDMTGEQLEEMISYALTFTRMSPDDAARIFVEVYEQVDVAAILYYMSERQRAPIMAAFEPRYAAEITEIWLYNDWGDIG